MSADVRRDTDLVEVRLVGFPVSLHATSEEHHGELLREFAHISNADDGSPGRVPVRLLALVAEIRQTYAPFSEPVRGQIEAARSQGVAAMDLLYQVPPSVGPAARELAGLLDQADEFCRQGHLLTLAADPDVVAFRRWMLEEFARQVDGADPRPWPQHTGAPDTGPVHTRPMPTGQADD